ncbi:MAG TPA: glycosyltransferase [Polyangia bacterium]|jgi:glycosyltransferase involved in cell wall biosynthesis|nr:glycosyltransferase [Polyangia bacterium]
MVIAHVLSSLAIGGQERVVLDLAGGQAADNRVIAVSLAPERGGPGVLAGQFEQRGVTVRHVRKRPGLDPTLPLRLGALFRKERATVVHTHNRLPLMYGSAAGKLAGAAVVHTRHGPGMGTATQRWLRRRAAFFLDAYVAVSPEMSALAMKMHDCSPAKICIIENGIDLGRFFPDPAKRAELRRELGIPEGAWVVGTVGRLAVEKAYHRLIAAAAPLLGAQARLVIVGDGAEAPRLREAAKAHNVEAFVHMPGARDDVPRFLAAFDVFALSSRMEGLPLVILEAMATELPIVATAVGGIPGAVAPGETGLLAPPDDETALREHLRQLKLDRPLGQRLGKRGREIALHRYSKDRMVREYLNLYRRHRASS